MKITIFGAAGEVGSRIVTEALARHHTVTAIVREASQFSKLPQNVTPLTGNASSVKDVVALSEAQDLIISALRPPTGYETELIDMTQSLLDGVAQSNTRIIIVGGAATLKLPGQGDTTVLTAPDFLPQDVINIARACAAQHELCRANQDANWTYASPPAMLIPGQRTGSYRLGADELLVDKEGVSQISMEDFAVALLDEAEQVKHRRARFTAAY